MCPPGVDQTCRTSQQWHLLAPSRHQRLSLGPRKTPEAFLRGAAIQGDTTLGLFDKLAWPYAALSQTTSKVSVLGENVSLSPIERLPTELLAMIMDDQELQTTDVINIGLCSRYLWSHTMLHVRRNVRESPPAWARQPLLCSGTWLTELPPAIYERYPEEQKRQEVYQKRVGRWYGPCPARVWNWNAVSVDDELNKHIDRSIRQTWFDALKTCVDSSDISGAMLESLWEDMLEVFALAEDDSSQLILRNLDTREYFRLSVRSSIDRHMLTILVMGSEWLTLDKALLSKICWGTPVRNARPGDMEWKLNHGVWAGHTFDVISDDTINIDGWKDVTRTIVEDNQIWRTQHRS
ncbi:uncharacterized protein N0V89_003624 [Didymosphaeria variabile]|uniref:Uncharacterized protein n=1 Tax=Didymosphaeria variabile TaxID=1932322 RepID=A0A9W8XNR1_9PLEO|nr:uncharacterized protein N0V89_003624 [Didymosphaeria variabile]KAJ4355604.1 hypothetical protein N0V89_003624 [Didymosphaeria variabile]